MNEVAEGGRHGENTLWMPREDRGNRGEGDNSGRTVAFGTPPAVLPAVSRAGPDTQVTPEGTVLDYALPSDITKMFTLEGLVANVIPSKRTRFFSRMDICVKRTRDMVFHSVSVLVDRRFSVLACNTLASQTTRFSTSFCSPIPAFDRCR